ncbi:hypothetical protein [Candidatus Phytoplasma australiense]|uniref:hypothetical protein n=1 Tax=Phytoplasma australiense TaxID=59748 RepID=UPI001F422CE5|nr:hypothetical protein [Candidatus Phytoplasma australiense]
MKQIILVLVALFFTFGVFVYPGSLWYRLGDFWVFYVYLLKWFGFEYFEKYFNKTINFHKYFPISVFYYEKQKKLQEQAQKLKDKNIINYQH